MTQQQQNSLVQSQSAQLVQVGDRLYQISEVSQQPQPIQPYSIAPQPVHQRSFWDEPKNLLLVGCGVVAGTGILTALVMKAFAPMPTASTQPQTVIVQPPVPEKKPYTREECRPAGLFGWGQDCYRERGYQ